jgi:hypothetical protein
MTLFVDPAALRDLSAGAAPVLLAHAGVARAGDLALPGLALWLATPEPGDGGGAVRLHRPGGDPSLATRALPAPPAGVLAVVAPDAAAAAPVLAALAGVEPPVVEAADAAAALPALARVAVAALAAERAAAGDLHAAVATLRGEAEDTRVAMLAALQGDGHRIPPPPPVLALDAPPSPAGHSAALGAPGREGLGQALGTSLEGIAALALHVAEAPPAEAWLRVRLYGAESGRVHGSWAVPGGALAPGWVHLDLPTPIGPVRESACLDLRADPPAPDGGGVLLSLEDRHAPPDRAAAQGGAPGERALALRVWTAPFGRRFTVAPHWDWEEVELSLAGSPGAAPPDVPLGVKVQLPAQVWAAALLPQGRAERVALGAEPPRLVAEMGGGERCLFVLPSVPVAGLDLLQAEVFAAVGDAGLLEAALWLQPAGAAIASEADLSLSAPGARWSGWRRSGPGGAPLRVSLLLLPAGAPALAAVLVLRNLGTAPEDLLRVEWSELTGARLREPLAVAAGQDSAAAGPFHRARPPAATLPRLPAGEIPKVAQIRLQEHYETEDGGYRHLDILVVGMQAAGFTWPRLRFKLAVGGDDPVLEFRSRPDWPSMFEAWPGRQVDEHGAFLLLSSADIARGFLSRLRSERDRWMLVALVRLMPTAVATAAREVVSDPAEYDSWVDLAKRVAAALPREAA